MNLQHCQASMGLDWPGGALARAPCLSGLCHSLASGQAGWKKVVSVLPSEPESHREASWEALDKHCLKSSAQCMKMVGMRPCNGNGDYA